MKIVALLCFACIMTSCAAQSERRTVTSASQSDMQTVRLRFLDSIVPSDRSERRKLSDDASRWATALREDGSWGDINYAGVAPSEWELKPHLTRMTSMSKFCYLAQRDRGQPDAKLLAATRAALSHWLTHDYRNTNWWWNEIGVPLYVGSTALLIESDLQPEQRQGVIAILKRSVWTKWTGQNLVWGVANQITRGLLDRDEKLIAQAYARMYDEIKVTEAEGIQADESFHQHGPQLYSGGYGYGFAQDVGRFIAFAWGTDWQVPRDKLDIYARFVLDGETWMTWGSTFDHSALGREITRKGRSAAGLIPTIQMLAELPIPRRDEFQAFASRLRSDDGAAPVIGNKHFWRSDYMSHRRTGYFGSIKMFSTRMTNAELVNNEGRKSHHLSDGAMLLYRSGAEYRDIFAAWDWSKIPGTTAEQAEDMNAIDPPKGVGVKGKTSFVGGVSDGTYGLAAMHLLRGNLSARKAWFCFDDEIVCLGSGISCTTDNETVTSVNQCHLKGEITRSPDFAWVHHDGVGYVFPNKQDVRLAGGPQTGRWSDFGTGSMEPVTIPVFNLSISHGTRASSASYEYIVLTGASSSQTSSYSRSPRIEILSNTPQLQAVRHADLKLTMIAFWQAGHIGAIAADRPCFVIVGDGHLAVSNPENKPMHVNVSIGANSYALDLPDGPRAGSSVIRPLKQR